MKKTPITILRNVFGHNDFRGRQSEIINRLLGGGHALVLMPTGMGKSLCYQITALLQDELTLVVSPLIALMKDQVDSLKKRGVDAEFINSSLDRDEREARYKALGEGKYRLLYVTPERFRKDDFREALSRRTVALLAVDEAHCISEWGHDFRPDYTRLEEIRELVGNPVTVALTATATPAVQEDIIKQLGLSPGEMETYHHGIERPNLHLEVRELWGKDEKFAAIREIIRNNPGSGIIYFTLIRTLDEFSSKLKDIEHVIYHGKLSPRERKAVQDRFMSGDGAVVFATNAFGMGIDKEAIRFVIHAEVPGSMESYYQEIGRAGRDGRDSVCSLLYDQDDLETQMNFLTWSNPSQEYYHRVYSLLVERQDAANAFGLDWMREQLHFKDRGNHTLETAIAMLDRYGITEGDLEGKNLKLVSELPAALKDEERLAAKLKRDQEKLYALVEYVRCEESRKDFIHHYFGLSPA